MRRWVREPLVGAAIALAAFGGVYWQAEPGEGGALPRLVCPLH